MIYEILESRVEVSFILGDIRVLFGEIRLTLGMTWVLILRIRNV